MSTDLDIDTVQPAQALIKQHGTKASYQAVMMINETLNKGDLEGCKAWIQIAIAIEDIINEPEEELR